MCSGVEKRNAAEDTKQENSLHVFALWVLLSVVCVRSMKKFKFWKENRSSQTEKPALMPFLIYTFCATKFLKVFNIDSCFNIRRIIRLKRQRSLKGTPNHFALRMNEFNQEFLFPVATKICLRVSGGNMT